jgi:hypothetical protein
MFNVSSRNLIQTQDSKIQIILKGNFQSQESFNVTWIRNEIDYYQHLILPSPGLYISSDDSKMKLPYKAFVGLKLNKVGEKDYYTEDATLNSWFQYAVEKELFQGCYKKPIEHDGFQLLLDKGQFTLNWIGKINNFGCLLKNYRDIKIEEKVAEYQASFDFYPKGGFHSKLILKSSVAEKHYFYVELSKNVFIDPFEINRIRFDGATVKVIGNVDLEAPANSIHATKHIALVQISNVQRLHRHLEIPIHFRYQTPDDVKKYAKVTVNAPVLIVQNEATNCNPAIVPTNILSELNTNSCLKLMRIGGESSFEIPIGNSSLQNQISMYTFICSFIGVFIVLGAMILSPRRAKTKTE